MSSGFLRTAQYFELVKDTTKELDHSYSPSRSNPYHHLQEEMEEMGGNGANGETGLVEFKNVYFRYPNRRDYLFEGLSFMIKPGGREWR